MDTIPSEARELVTIMLNGDARFARDCLNENADPRELAWELLGMFTGYLHSSSRGSDPRNAWSQALLTAESNRVSG